MTGCGGSGPGPGLCAVEQGTAAGHHVWPHRLLQHGLNRLLQHEQSRQLCCVTCVLCHWIPHACPCFVRVCVCVCRRERQGWISAQQAVSGAGVPRSIMCLLLLRVGRVLEPPSVTQVLF